jgi:hypothetical protein
VKALRRAVLGAALAGCASGSFSDKTGPVATGLADGAPPPGGDVDGAAPPPDGGSLATDAGPQPRNDGPTGPTPRDPCVGAGTCPPGVWINVTPADMPAVDLGPTTGAFGPGSIAGDPARPSDLYVGGSKSGLWKSSDYGNTWKQLSTQTPDTARGMVIAVAGSTPATVWVAGYNVLFKSVDGGVTFQKLNQTISLYSLKIDPNDNNHLVSGLHEVDGVAESTDGGTTWRMAGRTGFPTGGVSWYPFFIDTGDPATTRKTWLAYAQNGASPIVTRDGGATWTIPDGIKGLQHPHGNAQIFQSGSALFVAGIAGPGQGVYRSTDLGRTFARVDSGQSQEAIVWGTPKNVYAMYAWACSNCNVGTMFEMAPQPGTSWSKVPVPAGLQIGPNSLVVTSDGTHHIFVGLMWAQGLWRYVEP